MCQLPRTQPKSVAFINNMIAGFTKYPATFPSADIGKLQASLDNFHQARDAYNDTRSAFKQAGQEQKRAFEELKAVIANQIKAAQVDTAGQTEKLGLIGSGPRRKKSSVNLPVQPQLLDAKALAAGVVKLRWKKTTKLHRGSIRSFIVESRILNNGDTTGWGIAGSSFDCNVVLKNQPQGVKLEYRVAAANRSGESYPSNVLTVIL